MGGVSLFFAGGKRGGRHTRELVGGGGKGAVFFLNEVRD